jgi:hypothetical protein
VESKAKLKQLQLYEKTVLIEFLVGADWSDLQRSGAA